MSCVPCALNPASCTPSGPSIQTHEWTSVCWVLGGHPDIFTCSDWTKTAAGSVEVMWLTHLRCQPVIMDFPADLLVCTVLCCPGVSKWSNGRCVYSSDTLAHIRVHWHTHIQRDRELCSDHCQAKACNMIRTFFFHMNTDALHVSTRRLTSFQHGIDPTVHTPMHYGSFTLHKVHFCYMVVFIHDSDWLQT